MAQPGLATATTGAPVAAMASRLLAPQPAGQLGLEDAVEAGRPAAAAAVAELDALGARAGAACARGSMPLGVEVVAGVVDGHAAQPAVARGQLELDQVARPLGHPLGPLRPLRVVGQQLAVARTWALQPDAFTTTISAPSSSGMRSRAIALAASGWP